jgi:hypothetical protein
MLEPPDTGQSKSAANPLALGPNQMDAGVRRWDAALPQRLDEAALDWRYFSIKSQAVAPASRVDISFCLFDKLPREYCPEPDEPVAAGGALFADRIYRSSVAL